MGQGCVCRKHNETDEFLYLTESGLQKSRAAQRLVLRDRYDGDLLNKVKGLPMHPRAANLFDVGNHCQKTGKDYTLAGNSVRKIYITQAMIKEYGTTDGCPKCGEWGASHSAECQRRFEQKLKDAGKAFDIGSSDRGNPGQNSTPVVDISIPLPRSVGNTVQGSSSGSSGGSGPSSDVASNPDST